MPWEVVLHSARRGRSRLEDYIRELHRAGDRSAVATLQRYIELLEENGPGLGMPQGRALDEGLACLNYEQAITAWHTG